MSKITFEQFQLANYSRCPIVTDGVIAKLYNITGKNVYVLPQGENAKSFSNVEKLCSWFLARHTEPGDTVVAVGGGSVGDTVGFATSIYKRGVNILHVPTTLIAQIDSSIGGKTAINLNGVKNAVGTYHTGDTLIDTGFLQTLDSEQILSGMGEILKYRMLTDTVERAYANGNGKWLDIVKACVNYKQYICETDPTCNGIRNVLNFGHTIGHALELTQGISHGVAVANGIYYETKLAEHLNICTREYVNKWLTEIGSVFPIYPIIEQALALTLDDKKNAQLKVCFVLPTKFDRVYLTLNEVKEALLK